MKLAIGQHVTVISPDVGRHAVAAIITGGPIFMSAGLMFKVRLLTGEGRSLWIAEASICPSQD